MGRASGPPGRCLGRFGIVLMVNIACIIVFASTAYAGSHFSGWDSVDGRIIAYEDSTKYGGALSHAVGTWNALGDIDIKIDDSTTICDLEVNDVHVPGVNWYGRAYQQPGADHLEMNVTKLDALGVGTQRWARYVRHTMAHEWGHPLGLGDHTDDRWWGQLLMYAYIDEVVAPIEDPMAHDTTDYHALW